MSKAFGCPACGAKTWGDLKFCPGCGKALDVVCAGCGHTERYIQAEGYKFCPKCGGALGDGHKISVKKGTQHV